MNQDAMDKVTCGHPIQYTCSTATMLSNAKVCKARSWDWSENKWSDVPVLIISTQGQHQKGICLSVMFQAVQLCTMPSALAGLSWCQAQGQL